MCYLTTKAEVPPYDKIQPIYRSSSSSGAVKGIAFFTGKALTDGTRQINQQPSATPK